MSNLYRFGLAQCCFLITIAGCTPNIARCVCGEAEGEGFLGQVAVAQAIKNRGTLKGVYGCRSKRETTETCIRAVNVAKRYPDIIGGANHWLSGKVRPSWVKNCTKTVKIKNHKFYKCSKGVIRVACQKKVSKKGMRKMRGKK